MLRHFLTLLCCLAWPALSHAQITLNKTADISFGTIDFSGSTGSGNITLGTNGTLTYGANTSGNGIGSVGQIEIQGTNGTAVDISCSNGTLTNGGNSLNINPVVINIGSSNVTSYGGGLACAGLNNNIALHTIDPTGANNIVFFGGQLVTNGIALANGSYQAANSGGTRPTLRVVLH